MAAIPGIRVEAEDPYERGRQRGAQVASALDRTWPIYQSLFAVTAQDAGRTWVDTSVQTTACLDAVASWSPGLLRELEGVAAGADLPLSTIMTINARTEVFALAGGPDLTECSTIVQLAGPEDSAVSGQTWDWHVELADGWHVQEVHGGRYGYVGLCEFGMLAKIGVNDAGLGVHFNLLRHESDAGMSATGDGGPLPGVPVHLVAAAILAETRTVAEAVDLARSAPIAASTVITVVTPEDAACIELSPAGVSVVPPTDGWLVHTNHFLDPELSVGEGVPRVGTTTIEREELLRKRVADETEPLELETMTQLLCAHDDGAAVCRHLDESMPHGYRSATLATVALDPSHRTARVSRDGPCRRTDVAVLIATN